MLLRHNADHISLGVVAKHQVVLPLDAYRASQRHARHIAAELGMDDWESSLAAYWSIETRLRQWQRLLEKIGPHYVDAARIIEIGSGLGLFTLVGRLLKYTIVGIEPSSDRYEASLRVARRVFADNGIGNSLIQASSEALPLPSASVDIVTSFQTLEHVANLAQTLGEMRRVLRPGGVLFAQVPNYASWYEAHYGVLVPLWLGKDSAKRLVRLYGRPCRFLNHLQWLTPSTLRAMLHAAGFSRVNVRKAINPPLPASERNTSTQLPFRFRRGRVVRPLAYGLAMATEKLGISGDTYPQLEIWAEA